MKKEKRKLTKFEKWFRFMRRVHRFIVQPVFPYKKYGHKQRYNDRSYIMVCNHKSIMDVVLPVMATDKPVHFMAKKELFQKGLGKWFTRKCECIPVSRDGTDVRAIMQGMKYLKEGGVVAIFPEGTRNKTDERFLPFKSGAAAIAVKTQTPIVPMVQIKKIRFLKRAHVLFGEPFEFTEFYGKRLTEEDVLVCDEILKQKLSDLYDRLVEIRTKKGKKKK